MCFGKIITDFGPSLVDGELILNFSTAAPSSYECLAIIQPLITGYRNVADLVEIYAKSLRLNSTGQGHLL